MKKIILAAIMLLSLNVGVQAQSVERKGNNFTQISDNKGGKSSGKEVKTQYTYTDSKGNVYPISLRRSPRRLAKNIASTYQK